MGLSFIPRCPGGNIIIYIKTIGPRVSKWMGKKVSYGNAFIACNAFICGAVSARYFFNPKASPEKQLAETQKVSQK